MNARRRARGQSMLEFALAFPVILLIIIIFVELGRVVYYYSALNNAVREGARYAIVNQFLSSDDRRTKVQETVAKYAVALPLDVNGITVYCDRDTSNTSNPCENYITVSADIQIDPIIPFFARMINGGSAFRIIARSTMQTTPYGSSDE